MRREMAMRGEQRRRHVVLYVAHGNRMRCRFNRDSVLNTPHVQPPCITPSTVFSVRQPLARNGLLQAGVCISATQAGHASHAVRSAKRGENTRCLLRAAFYVNTSAAVKRCA